MKKGEHGFTLVELLVVISTIALLLAILMPALSKVREQGRSVVCLSNLRQVGLANSMYIQDKGSYLVQNGYYAVYLAPYLSGSAQNPKQISKLFHCPSDKLNEKGRYFTYTFGSVNSYCINMYFDLHNSNRGKTELWKFLKVSDIRRPPSKVFLRTDQFWADLGTNWVCNKVAGMSDRDVIADAWMKKMTWHKEKSNMLYCDGHVETIKKADAMTGPLSGCWPLR